MENLKLEVGQYWHSLGNGCEWLVTTEMNNYILCECTKENSYFHLGVMEQFNLDYFSLNGYVLGRHPDSIEPEDMTEQRLERIGDVYGWVADTENTMQWQELEHGVKICIKSGGDYKVGDTCYDWNFLNTEYWKFLYNVNDQAPHPEQWQPKEGEVVWVKFLETNARIIGFGSNKSGGLQYTIIYTSKILDEPFPVSLSELEPYTDQDKPKIDFSIAGQWLKAGSTVVCTFGEVEGDNYFYCHYLGGLGWQPKKMRVEADWRLLTPEQINPILELMSAL